jgi:hypothetical protein
VESKAHAHNNQRSCQILRLYGCTEYCFNAGYAHWDLMIQQLLSKFPIALINKDPNKVWVMSTKILVKKFWPLVCVERVIRLGQSILT